MELVDKLIEFSQRLYSVGTPQTYIVAGIVLMLVVMWSWRLDRNRGMRRLKR